MPILQRSISRPPPVNVRRSGKSVTEQVVVREYPVTGSRGCPCYRCRSRGQQPIGLRHEPVITESLNVVRGTNGKPVSTDALVADLLECDLKGELLVGYPVMASPEGRYAIDALLVSPDVGLVCFDLIEGVDAGDFADRQDDAYNKLSARLLAHRNLVDRRTLLTPIHTVSYAPAISNPPADGDHPVLDRSALRPRMSEMKWPDVSQDLYEATLSAIQSITAIRRAGSARKTRDAGSKGARLTAIEDSISTLDRLQSKAVIETVDGVQRIRGLAGSGKTIVLALKAAYLHAQHPDWRMAVTFNTRSLKAHFTRLINNFSIEQTGEEPNWDNLRIVNSWGAPGASDRDGIYHEFCREHEINYLDFSAARRAYSTAGAFQGVVSAALDQVAEPKPLYDAILVDEAQDFSPAFLRLCYEILEEPKRLVYAYDELQNLTNAGLPPVEEIFGARDGEPRVTFSSGTDEIAGRRDIILEKCYRNSRPVLVTAHALGFGVYRDPPAGSNTGLVQMFGQPELWTDIGYRPEDGGLALGRDVTLARTPETSPAFLESHSPLADLVVFKEFDDEQTQAEWVADQIKRDLGPGELRYDDIVVVNTNPVSARSKIGKVRKALLELKIPSHLAGVDTSPDVFYRADSITCTGIHRAKGNEAAMVYVINGDECHSSAANLSRVRNRLFTAITRSKAWVRVTGVGAGMQSIIKEYERIRDADFRLSFRYPNQDELDQLTVVHRDVSVHEERIVASRRESVSTLVEDLRQGRLFPEDLDERDLDALRELLDRRPE